MVSGMALPESVNFGSKWAEISADDGKNWFFSVRIRQNAENRLVLSKKRTVLSIVLSRFWANEQKRKVRQTRLFTGLFGGELGIRTLGSFWEHSISSAAPSTTRTTLRVCNSAFLPKTFGKNWRKEQQNIQFSNRRKPCIYGLFKRSKQPTLQKISSQPRYDRFDTFPYSAKAWKNTICAYYFIGFERKSQAFFGKKVDIYRAMRLQ